MLRRRSRPGIPTRSKKPKVSSGPTLLSSISGLNVEFELDATLSGSYSGSGQTWSNLNESPYSAAAQTALDFYLGADGTADATDPTFTGTAGDSGAYFAFDGGDYLTIKSGSNTSFLSTMHQSGEHFWFAAAFKTPDASVVQRLFETWGTTNGTSIWITGNQFRALVEQSGSMAVSTAAGTISNATDTLFIVSWNGTDTLRYWINTTTSSTQALADPAAADAAADTAATLCARSNASQYFSSGNRLYHMSCGQGYLTDAKAASVFSILEARHSRDYTP